VNDIKDNDIGSESSYKSSGDDYTKEVLSQMFLPMIWCARKYVRIIARDVSMAYTMN